MKPSKDQLRALRADNRKFGSDFVSIPREQWVPHPTDHTEKFRQTVWRNRFYLVQHFVESDGMIRLTINRSDVDRNGEWKDGITWEELQDIKAKVGFADHAAVEVFPPASHCVNVAAMRHLWIVPQQMPVLVPIWGVNR